MYPVSEITVSYNPNFKISERPQITDSQITTKLFREFWSDDLNLYESVNVLFLTNSNHVLGISKISSGGINSCLVNVFKILQIALKCHASSIILAHNHPSGILLPSSADLQTTKNLYDCAAMMDIKLIDHIILTETGYTSFKDENFL